MDGMSSSVRATVMDVISTSQNVIYSATFAHRSALLFNQKWMTCVLGNPGSEGRNIELEAGELGVRGHPILTDYPTVQP